MLTSRASMLLRAARFSIKNKPIVLNQIRNSGHQCYYREAAPPNTKHIRIAEMIGGFFWWWVLWHMFTEPGHVFGEFEYPNANAWTDEELGIPPE